MRCDRDVVAAGEEEEAPELGGELGQVSVRFLFRQRLDTTRSIRSNRLVARPRSHMIWREARLHPGSCMRLTGLARSSAIDAS